MTILPALVLVATTTMVTDLLQALPGLAWGWRFVLLAEAVFLLAFLASYWMRLQNSDLWHPVNGGEKPMDFAYLNGLSRTTDLTQGPVDPWQAGAYMNYYWYGQFIAATVTKLTGVVPEVAYNLLVPMFFALTAAATFSLTYNLAEGTRQLMRRRPGRLRIGAAGPIIAGLLAIFLVLVSGNLAAVGQRAGAHVEAERLPARQQLLQRTRQLLLLIRSLLRYHHVLPGGQPVGSGDHAPQRLRDPAAHPQGQEVLFQLLGHGIFEFGDLGQPGRFLSLFWYNDGATPYINTQSPLSIGSWALWVFAFFAGLAFVDNLIADGVAARFFGIPGVKAVATLFGQAYTRGPRKVYAVIGSAAGFFIAGYTGVLLNLTARPFWAATDPWMGALFIASATSTGAAAIALFQKEWGSRFESGGAGKLIRLEE